MIPYGRQTITDADVEAVIAVLRSDFLTQGAKVPEFEGRVAALCDVPHAVAMNSATSALHVACLALGVGEGDLVWTSPVTFVASANCALYCGADVDFVDIDPVTLNMSPAALERKLGDAAATGRLPKVIIPVHLTGEPCDMPRIGALAARYGVRVIEDASHAIGAQQHGVPIGACQHSDIVVFSFHPVKIITTGEGGMATTRDAELARRMELLRSHGITRDPGCLERAGEGTWYYEQQVLGFNYRMTDIHAALGIAQLSNIEAWIGRRHAIAGEYDRALRQLPLVLPTRAATSRSALHLYVVQLDRTRTDLPRRTVYDRLRAAGIGVNVHYIPVHLQPFYRARGFRPGDFPASEAYYAQALSLPMYAGLTPDLQGEVVAKLERALA